ncbi:MAG: heme exporter protein CcmB [Acidimicrobiales bacterium]
MLHDAWLMAQKDLRIEQGSRVVLGQILPFGALILILFGLAIAPDLTVVGTGRRSVLAQASPGLFWLAVLFSTLLALGRSFAIESSDGNLDALKMAGLDPAGIFVGKAAAVAVQLLILEVLLGFGAFVLYGAPLANVVLLATVLILATTAVTLAGTLYAALASGLRVRDTLVPLLVLPVLAPVLLAATLATEAALFGSTGNGWSWTLLLGVFALLYLGIGMLSFGPIMEES